MGYCKELMWGKETDFGQIVQNRFFEILRFFETPCIIYTISMFPSFSQATDHFRIAIT